MSLARPHPRTSLIALLAAASCCAAAAGQYQPDEVPEELEGITIDDHTGGQVPLDLPFVDETGKPVVLRDYFGSGKPVILTLNYYLCPQLCTLTLNGMVDALNRIDWAAGREFEIVTVSINHEEGPDLALAKKKGYLTLYEAESAAEGWHFLTGEQEHIETLADAVGFRYRRDPETGLYGHVASIMFITPDGRISRYMNDVMFEPRDVRLALVESSEGAIGSPLEKMLLFTCFQYDPGSNSYALSALKLMRLGGFLTVIAIGAGLLVLKARGGKGRRAGIATDGLHS